jgi:transcriptional regulator with XRE-family HTH domain
MKPLALNSNLSKSENKRLREEFSKRVAKRLKEIRQSKKITQQQLAEKASLHLTYIGHLELAKYHPTVYVMWKIAKALKVSLDELTRV